MSQKLLKQQHLPYQYLFYQCVFHYQHNVPNNPYSDIGLNARPIQDKKKGNNLNTLSCQPREADCSANLKVLYTHRKVAVLFQPPTPFPSHLGVMSPCWSVVGQAEPGSLSQQSNWKSKASHGPSLLHWSYDNKCKYSPNQLCFVYLKLLPSNFNDFLTFLLRSFLFLCIFNCFSTSYFFLSFSRLGVVTNRNHHLSNDSTKKTEAVKQTICPQQSVFTLYSLSTLFYRG